RVLSSFEGESPLEGWHASGDVRLAPSRARASRGEGSLEIVYGPSGWRMPRLDFDRPETSDWRGWDTFEFDIYNAEPEPVPLRVILHGGGLPSLYSHNITVPPGRWHRYRMSARRFPARAEADVDRSAITG